MFETVKQWVIDNPIKSVVGLIVVIVILGVIF